MPQPFLTGAMGYLARASLVRSRARASEMVRRARGEDPLSLAQSDPQALTPAQRLVACVRFFDVHSGFPLRPPGRYGFGQGMVDFLTWEIASARLEERRRTAWWRVVSGRLVLDLAAAETVIVTAENEDAVEPAVAAWLEYARFVDGGSFRLDRAALSTSLPASLAGSLAKAQRLFWRAHQLSLYRGIEEAEPLHARLAALERRFIDEIVLHNVNCAALSNDLTYLDSVGLFAFLVYPSGYPTSRSQLAWARRLRVDDVPLSASYRKRYDDVGRDSRRWRPVPVQNV